MYLILSLHIILSRVIQNDFSTKSLVFAHYFIIKFSKLKSIYYALLLSLAGLPPFLLFFVKANYIISFIGSVNFYCSLIIFLCFFLNMLFYTQLYLQKNYIFDDTDFFNHRDEIKPHDYKIIKKIILLLVITMFGVVLAPDLFFITNLFFS